VTCQPCMLARASGIALRCVECLIDCECGGSQVPRTALKRPVIIRALSYWEAVELAHPVTVRRRHACYPRTVDREVTTGRPGGRL